METTPSVCGLILALVAGCGSQQPQTDAVIQAADPFANLPTDGKRCVLVRPGAASPQQRQLAGHYSRAHPLAWEHGVISWAQVSLDQAWRAEVELSIPAEEFIEAVGGVLVEGPWEDVCTGDCQVPRMWVIGPRRLGAGAHYWHHFDHSPARCQFVANPQVVEQGLTSRAKRFRTTVGAGITLAHEVRSALSLRRRDLVTPSPETARFDGGVWQVVHFRLDDIALREQDERFRRQAMLERAQAQRPSPVDRIRMHDVRELRRQLELWTQEARGRGEAARAELSRLVSRIATAHVGNRILMLESARACLAEGCAEVVLPWLDTFIRQGGADERVLLFRRWAARDSAPDRLPSLLEADGVTRSGQSAASMLTSQENYQAAEAAWRADESLPSPRLARASGRLPVATLHETLVGLLDGTGDPLRVLYIRTDFRGQNDDVQHRVDPPLLRVAWPHGDGVRQIALVPLTHDISQAQAVWNGLRGEVTLTLALGDELAPGPALSIRGRVEGEEFVIHAASARYDWSAVRRFVSEPLERLSRRLFPQPPYRFEASEAEQAILEERARADESIACASGQDGGGVFECAVSPERTSARRSMVEVVRPLLR